MKIYRSIGYALLAVGYIAKNQKNGVILSQKIAKEYNISLEYLLKILQQLVKGNVLRSKRGPRGGFCLAHPLNKMTMLQVVEAVEGPLVSQLYLDEHAPGLAFGIKTEKAYEKALAASRSVFEKTKLSSLI